ncbi:MAG: alkaline phosphatase family protein [Actinobacteria bacterium]|nr:alkaline phosphatase family protein [Actinomycetota bacterium]
MDRRPDPRALVVFAVLAGLVGLAIGIAGSLVLGVAAGIVILGLGLAIAAWGPGRGDGAGTDPGRRNLLVAAGLGGLAWTVAGPSIGWAARKLGRTDPRPLQEAMASDLGAEYMELVRRNFVPRRSGDLQLLLAPFNSANYPQESLALVPRDPRTSHASVWMYLERIPLVVHAPGLVVAGDSDERVTLSDLAPTTAQLMGFSAWPDDREGRVLPLATSRSLRRPKAVVTYVIDGGGWNVLDAFPNDWPELKALMGESANFRNAIMGSFPAVTACAHASIGTGTFPNRHGITGHNIRDEQGRVRKAYDTPGKAQPGDIWLPTLSDLWHEQTGAWVGQIGYQVWHLGMMGFGGRDRPADDLPVGVFWDEDGTATWQPHNPELYRLPASMPPPESYERYADEFDDPGWDAQFAPKGRQSPCCSPPIVRYQGDVIEAAFDSEPIGEGATSLLYTTYKSPDYTGHIYGMGSRWTGLQLRAVDEQLGRLRRMLDARFSGEYALIVTADHGQCPLPDSVGGVRLDPIQLEHLIESRFSGVTGVVESVVPSEVFLNVSRLWDNGGATIEHVAATLADYRYRQNIGAYVPRSAVEQDLLDQKEFAAVFGSTFLESLAGRELARYGATAYPDGDHGGMPGPLL